MRSNTFLRKAVIIKRIHIGISRSTEDRTSLLPHKVWWALASQPMINGMPLDPVNNMGNIAQRDISHVLSQREVSLALFPGYVRWNALSTAWFFFLKLEYIDVGNTLGNNLRQIIAWATNPIGSVCEHIFRVSQIFMVYIYTMCPNFWEMFRKMSNTEIWSEQYFASNVYGHVVFY